MDSGAGVCLGGGFGKKIIFFRHVDTAEKCLNIWIWVHRMMLDKKFETWATNCLP